MPFFIDLIFDIKDTNLSSKKRTLVLKSTFSLVRMTFLIPPILPTTQQSFNLNIKILYKFCTVLKQMMNCLI